METGLPGSEPTDPELQGDEEHDPTEREPRAGLSTRLALALVVLVVIVGGVAVLTVSGGQSRPSVGKLHGVASARFSGSVASPAEQEPPLSLRNYNGQLVNIDQYRGKAVLVTFLYTKCVDVCPLIASNLGVALNSMGPAKASRVQVMAVSVDPRGDNRKSVEAFLREHRMFGRMVYLIGSAHELAPVWKAWGIESERYAQNPALVNHSGLVYGVSASGKITTLYASNFTPSEIAHDAPLLASS